MKVTAGSRALGLALERTKCLGERALKESLCLQAVPPLGQDPFQYGDLVPLGFVLLAIRRTADVVSDPDCNELAERLRDYLWERRTRGLWSYHSGGLETSIDSALVLLGVSQPDAVEALEKFADAGLYVPQLHTHGVESGKMTVRQSLLHWCRPDYSIACLVRALRRREGLSTVTPISVLEAGFERRSGLYLANPYFPDWMLAMAIEGDSAAGVIRGQLQQEVAAGINPDGTFGSYDVLLSTALAVLSLQSVGGDARLMEQSIVALGDLMERDSGAPSTPFYSTEQFAWSQLPPRELLSLLTAGGGGQLITTSGQEHIITFYQDIHGLVTYSLTLLALLGGHTIASPLAAPVLPSETHKRYRCGSREDYIARFALPPYLTTQAAS